MKINREKLIRAAELSNQPAPPHVGAADVGDDDLPFAERFAAMREELDAQFAAADKLTNTIRERLSEVAND